MFSSHTFWTSSSLDVPAGVTQEEGRTGFLIHLPSAVPALIFLPRRIQLFLSLVDREVQFNVLTIFSNRSPFVWHFLFCFLDEEKSLLPGFEHKFQRVRRFRGGYQLNHRGDRLLKKKIVCVCMYVFFPYILDIKFVEGTSRGHTGGRSHRTSHPPSFCGACLNFSSEKDSAIPFPRRP